MTTQTLPVRRSTTSAVQSRESADWRHRSACRDQDPELFFSKSPEDREEAKRVCAGCPVRSQCLEWADEWGEKAGVWGGVARNRAEDDELVKRSYGSAHLPAAQDIIMNHLDRFNDAVARGLTAREVAEELQTNVQTVNNVLAAIQNGTVGWEGQAPDARAVQAYLTGADRDVHPRDRLAAVVKGVRQGMSYPDFDRMHGLARQATATFVSRTRQSFQAKGVEFPDLGRLPGRRLLSDQQVLDMRVVSAAGGVTDLELALRFNVSRKTVSSVVSGQSYREVGGPLRPVKKSSPSEGTRVMWAGKSAQSGSVESMGEAA